MPVVDPGRFTTHVVVYYVGTLVGLVDRAFYWPFPLRTQRTFRLVDLPQCHLLTFGVTLLVEFTPLFIVTVVPHVVGRSHVVRRWCL